MFWHLFSPLIHSPRAKVEPVRDEDGRVRTRQAACAACSSNLADGTGGQEQTGAFQAAPLWISRFDVHAWIQGHVWFPAVAGAGWDCNEKQI